MQGTVATIFQLVQQCLHEGPRANLTGQVHLAPLPLPVPCLSFFFFLQEEKDCFKACPERLSRSGMSNMQPLAACGPLQAHLWPVIPSSSPPEAFASCCLSLDDHVRRCYAGAGRWLANQVLTDQQDHLGAQQGVC